ncbi:hypothetical protein BaRGS_00008368 [Batillaria attramentaria]|uniref:Uncharacterized protein n=1 Tax=Batillaria attramentaria TaxID=370345 RepID=A0ABD0LMI1_9CAEN
MLDVVQSGLNYDVHQCHPPPSNWESYVADLAGCLICRSLRATQAQSQHKVRWFAGAVKHGCARGYAKVLVRLHYEKG